MLKRVIKRTFETGGQDIRVTVKVVVIYVVERWKDQMSRNMNS